ncbi:hypothetical protein NDU88_005906 [Pleurodeles waltl]|uniref:Uncharacterized protein n=1 Tax=Pleurodeles waltl TaxID=8319 RepID=A0AAV7L284_PLEWA|nr:hypothetical protein NDU88_005906 [Pleurodeles waltl]
MGVRSGGQAGLLAALEASSGPSQTSSAGVLQLTLYDSQLRLSRLLHLTTQMANAGAMLKAMLGWVLIELAMAMVVLGVQILGDSIRIGISRCSIPKKDEEFKMDLINKCSLKIAPLCTVVV